MNKVKIAIVGLKGIPAKWGGIEKYVEEVGKRLVKRGHEVTVFGSRWFCQDYSNKTYKGINIRRLPVINLQATDALSNAFLAMIAVAGGSLLRIQTYLIGLSPQKSLPKMIGNGWRLKLREMSA